MLNLIETLVAENQKLKQEIFHRRYSQNAAEVEQQAEFEAREPYSPKTIANEHYKASYSRSYAEALQESPPTSVAKNDAIRRGQKQRPCKYFRKNQCKFGANCKYSHEESVSIFCAEKVLV